MKRLLSITAFLATLSGAWACTVFFAFDGKHAIAGENEDWLDPNTQVWFVPAGKSTHGVIYFGFGKGTYPKGGVATPDLKKPFDGNVLSLKKEDVYGFPQSGINDQGLYFGGAATPAVNLPPDPKKKQYLGILMHYIMTHCSTVKEVLTVLDVYDARMPQGQLLFADKSGASIIVEATGKVLRRSGSFQVMTNFLRSETDQITCPRYLKVTDMLTPAKAVTPDLLASACQATSAKPPKEPASGRIVTWTQYSLVCDLTTGKVYVYRDADYDHAAVISVKSELAKGEHAATIASLFKG